MSRLQIGGLALVINAMNKDNIGKVVTILAFLESGYVEITGNDLVDLFGHKTKDGITLPENLMPLGDDKGVELYGLREEQKELN
ncbi:hypothetical protein [Acinetobacter calcoaceticus]|uniref:hypothetical protein n=1 Tax=Acinetobacter calcoaceticus TaxID=471 RepID=UPI000FD7D3C6|nr:hypothetical protein [Acinetobacter calcoaceticus]